jgi:hypothetical protein
MVARENTFHSTAKKHFNFFLFYIFVIFWLPHAILFQVIFLCFHFASFFIRPRQYKAIANKVPNGFLSSPRLELTAATSLFQKHCVGHNICSVLYPTLQFGRSVNPDFRIESFLIGGIVVVYKTLLLHSIFKNEKTHILSNLLV